MTVIAEPGTGYRNGSVGRALSGLVNERFPLVWVLGKRMTYFGEIGSVKLKGSVRLVVAALYGVDDSSVRGGAP